MAERGRGVKINEVEAAVGITKRNIRFYEKEGLLTPGRNSDNGYRDYGVEDVVTLKKIKLLRKLAIPLEEIRRMQKGILTLEDAVRRHIIQLERDRANLAAMQDMCASLLAGGESLNTLDVDTYLARMERQEEEGTRFLNIKKRDTYTKYLAPTVAALIFIALMVGVIALILWGLTVEPEGAPPVGLIIFLIAIPVVLILGVLLALGQRFKEIKGGEEDAAAQY